MFKTKIKLKKIVYFVVFLKMHHFLGINYTLTRHWLEFLCFIDLNNKNAYNIHTQDRLNIV